VGEKNLCISFAEIPISSGEICILVKEMGRWKRDIGISSGEIPISLFHYYKARKELM